MPSNKQFDKETKLLIDNMITHGLHLCSFGEHDYDQSLVDDICKATNRGYRTPLDTHFIMQDDKIVFIGSKTGAINFIATININGTQNKS